MGIQHISIKNGSSGNAKKHAQYISGDGKYGKRDDVVYVEDANLPSWAKNAEEFFDAADSLERSSSVRKEKTVDGIEYEKNIKGRAYKEIELAIPREAKNKIQWAKDFARDTLGDKHPFRMAIHDKEASDGGRNVHMHLMFSTREMDGYERTKEQFFKRAASAYRNPKTKKLVQRSRSEGGALKSKFWNSRDAVKDTRASFERHVQRVSPDFKMKRSDNPEPKIGPRLERAGKEYDNQRVERSSNVLKMREMKKEKANLDIEISKEVEINKKIGSGSNKSKQDIDGFLSKKSPTKKDNLMNRLDDSNEKEQGSIIQRLEVTEAPKETDKLWEKLEKNREDKENIDRDIDR